MNKDYLVQLLKSLRTEEAIESLRIEDVREIFGEKYEAVIGFMQNNPNHQYTLDKHLLFTVLYINQFLSEHEKTYGDVFRYADELLIAALYHDIGKIETAQISPKPGICSDADYISEVLKEFGYIGCNVSGTIDGSGALRLTMSNAAGEVIEMPEALRNRLLAEDEKNRPFVFYGHAEYSAKAIEDIYPVWGIEGNEREIISFFIKYHDVFISVKEPQFIRKPDKFSIPLTKEAMQELYKTKTAELPDGVDRLEIWKGIIMIAKADVSAQADRVIGWHYAGKEKWEFGEERWLSRSEKLRKLLAISKWENEFDAKR